VQHPEEVLGESLIPYNQSPKVLKPRKQSLDLPPPSVATQGTTVLRSVRPRLPVWRDQLHASPKQFCIQAVRLVGVVADETRGERPDESRCKRRPHQRHFMWRGALDVNGDGQALAICDGHDLRPLAALGLAHSRASLLRWREAPVDERFLQIQIAFVVERLREDFEDGPQQAGADPVLKSPMAGLIRGIAVGQVGPGRSGPQDPEDAIEHRAVRSPRAPSTVRPTRQAGLEGANEGPLLVREVTGVTGNGLGHPERMASP
jgi:hypothetical protein